MNDTRGLHRPAPEFRSALEHEIVRTLRRESRFSEAKRGMRTGRAHTVLVLTIGLILGAGVGLAPAQVQDARQRDELTSAIQLKRQLASVRMELAQKMYDETRRGFDVGTHTRSSLLAAEAELRSMQASVVRIDLDLAEVRASSAPPRDELWAPLVGGRDFVNERLSTEAATAQQRLAAVEAAAAEVDRRFQVGASGTVTVLDAKSEVDQARSEMSVIAQKLMLRQQFLDGKITADEITRQLQLFELTQQVERLIQKLQIARDRAALSEQHHKLGTISELDMRKAQLDMLSVSIKLEEFRDLVKRLEQTIKK